jgi:alpha-N-arabinofuranosidase
VVNTAGKEEVGVKKSKWDGEGKFKFSKHSMAILRWETVKKIVEVKRADSKSSNV